MVEHVQLRAMDHGSRTPHPGRLSSSGMTLFEVSISLVIVAFGVISALMVFPSGLKAQQLARFQVYASAKALEMIDSYNTSPTANPSLEVEAPHAWDVSASRCNMAFDLERRLSSYRFGIMPLPLELARRLDSDGDEIQQVLAEGGYLYYSQPQAATGFSDTGLSSAPPNDAQRLVFAVTGYAQSNAVPILPQKAWPYYMPFPSPPSHGTHGQERGFSEPSDSIETWGGKRGILFEDTFDRDMRPVFWCTIGGNEYGYRDHQRTHTLDSAKRYCQAALWYCKRKGIDALTYGSSTVLTAFPDSLPEVDHWKLVQALRFLSHATTSLTAYVTKSDLETGVSVNGGFDPTASGTTSDPFIVTLPVVQALHASTMNLTALFAACHPYDWAVPRPLQRAIMMDHPLIEYDLFSPPLSGSLSGLSGIAAQQWKPVPAQPIRHIGRSFQFSNQDVLGTSPTWTPAVGNTALPNATHWGNPAHFTLTRAFSPDERCRQLVFWVVDWQAYEDAETAPSAPLDAARYPRGAPRAPGGTPATFNNLLRDPPFFDWQQYVFRNPEKSLAFIQSMDGKPDGYDVRTLIVGSDGGGRTVNNQSIGNGNSRYDQAGRGGPNNKQAFIGLYGADRNFNLKLDRGTVPSSVRLRATSVARFNFYDLRVPASLR